MFAFQNPQAYFKAVRKRRDKEAEGVIREAHQVIVNKP